jgi:anhydro-N-acetylmuramic acid kinase
LQVGEAEIIAKRIGVVTVSDFRAADITAGGRGAPLAPIYHQQRFGQTGKERLVVNIGGIANISLLLGDSECYASDTGPGNCLIDHVTRVAFNKGYDDHGEIADGAEIDERLLEELKSDPLFSQPLPTALDRGEVLRLLRRQGVRPFGEYDPADLVATLTELTAWSVYDGARRLRSEAAPSEVLVCGGGAHNSFLMKRLQYYFDDAIVTATDRYGSDPDYVEAEAFAWLANLAVENRPGNVPQVTGAKRQVVLGKISLP